MAAARRRTRERAVDDARVRRHLRVAGVVQGVGFRPFVHRLATGLALTGHVGNDSGGVFCEVEGALAAVEQFTERLVTDAPPLARIDSVETAPLPAGGGQGFAIVVSRPRPGSLTLVAPDLAPCAACLTEMADPADRRYRYPLLNCTNCGPRFTIITDLPYDRPNTTLAGWPMCAACQAEYDDPGDRRFHAQPTACAACGPALWLEAPAGTRRGPHDSDPVTGARGMIAAGKIVAVKGAGGYHLACRADLDHPVRTLRARKHRPAKPLAVMVADVSTARRIAEVDDAAAGLLTGPERPIVILPARAGSGISPAVAPGPTADGLGLVGVMLPSSPLHSLLIAPDDVWVMTSGNRSTEPICTDDSEARERLRGIVDGILGHDRPITVACDDSVVRVLGGHDGPSLLPIRRSRGYAPYPVAVDLPAGPPLLAVGGELKATFCLRRGGHAFLSQHLGDMANLATLQAFERAVAHMTRLFGSDPEILVCDAHPAYLSADWARRHADGRPVVTVQHHHAHIASLLAEHRHVGPVIGFSFDGTGYGLDGTIWGGEVLLADLAGFERVGHLRPSLLAGGDAAVERPWRQALARLTDADLPWTADLAPVQAMPAGDRAVAQTQLRRQVNTVATTSMGRLFDAVASLCGLRQTVSYEGQAAIELEAVVDPAEASAYAIPIDDEGVWDTRPLIRAVVEDVVRGVEPTAIAARFHHGIVAAMVAAAEALRTTQGVDVVGLSGGVFQNVALTTHASTTLSARGFTVLTHRVVPPNDGGLALGQVAVAATRLAADQL